MGASHTFLAYLEEGEVLQRARVESLERVGIERLYFYQGGGGGPGGGLSQQPPAPHPRQSGALAGKFCILREHLSLSLHRALESPHLGAHVQLAKKSLGRSGKFMKEKDFPWNFVWEMLHRDYTL